MAIKKRSEMTINPKIEIDLHGPQGNSLCLLAFAQKNAKALGLDPGEVTKKMLAGDYENLIEVFGKYFGDHVVLFR